MATVWGGLVNAVLDPILIFGLDMELTGAALASVAARIAIAATALLPIIRHYGGIARPSGAELTPRPDAGFRNCRTGHPDPVGDADRTSLCDAFHGGIWRRCGRWHGHRGAYNAGGVRGNICALRAIGPIIGQNFGAGLHDRVRGAFRDGLIFTAVVVVLVSALLFALRWPLAGLFNADGLTRDLVFLFAGPLALMFFFNGMLFVSNAAFNNLGHPFYSTWLNWGRHTLGTIPTALIGGWYLGAQGILIGQAVGGLIFGVWAFWLAGRVMERAAVVGPVQPDSFSRQARLMSLLHLRR